MMLLIILVITIAEGVTALVAKRRTHGDYSHIHARFMDNARDDVMDFFKEIGLQVEK